MTVSPPGRATQLWLRQRRELVARGAEILEHKAYALAREQRRLRHHVDETARAFDQASSDADRWYRRAAVLGADQHVGLVRSRPIAPADARVGWRTIMGVTYPVRTGLDAAPPSAEITSVGRSAALAPAACTYQRAIAAALDHAAAQRALDLVTEELRVTTRRLRALEHRWLPDVDDALRTVGLAIAEREREDMVRARWLSDAQRGDES